MNRECAIVEDLLSLYAEKMLSQETTAFVREHLERCPKCREKWEKDYGNCQEADAFDGEFARKLQEAKALTAIRNQYRRRILAVALGTLACVLILAGIWFGVDWLQNTETLDFAMTAWEVNQAGEVQETLTLEVQGLLRHREDLDTFDGEIIAPDSYRYSFDGGRTGPYTQLPGLYDWDGFFTSASYFYDREQNDMEFMYFALDVEEGYMILRWQKGPTFPVSYLVASTDPAVTPQEILDHFGWFTALFG